MSRKNNSIEVKNFKEVKGYANLRSEYRELEITDAKTGDKKPIPTAAMILLERIEYWTKRHRGDLVDLIIEEKKYNGESLTDDASQQTLSKGWFYKSIAEMKEFSYLQESENTIRRYINDMVASNWLAKRPTEESFYNNVNDYRMIITNISHDLEMKGEKMPLEKETIEKVRKRLN